MKKNARKRAAVLSLAMAAMLALPTMASAQESRSNYGGLFGNPDQANKETGLMNAGGTRGAVTGNPINNQAFGDNTTPIGSGVLVLLAAGLGYAAMKKKED